MQFYKIFLTIIFILLPTALFANEPVKLGGEEQAQYERIEMKALQLTLQQRLLEVNAQLLKLNKQRSDQNNQSRTYLEWISVKPGKLPEKSTLAGYGKNGALYICRAQYKENIYPGEVTSKGCRISYAGKAFTTKQYEVLAGLGKTSWQPSNTLYRFRMTRTYPLRFNTGPEIFSQPIRFDQPQPIIGGHESNGVMYICRVIYKDSIFVGKVVEGFCNIGYNGKEYREPSYQVLFNNPLMHSN